ncbi:MAG: UDP-N-acetylmuramoyl-L-alanine--D-glutamate ligase [Candidatus Daviesbacteria bacterium]|nr:UDP-N-acetylmuramoyl-L-alanine--D-glutamate ligase [Candidatus Daviesbacteria bacterium]
MNSFKKVLVFGLGLNEGGVGSARFFARQGAEVRVTDLKTKEVLKSSLDELRDFPQIEYTLGEHKNEDIDWADLIIKNPAIKPGNPYLEYATKLGKQIDTDMGIFLQYVRPDQIIGVTGTKGKSTTASLIYEVLSKSLGVNLSHPRGGQRTHPWKNVILAGNIGKSVLDTISSVKKNSLVVLEISSFQLEAYDTHKISPKWAVITNITPDHLNYYVTMKDYVFSKRIIGKYQTQNDFLFIRRNDSLIDQANFLTGLKAHIIRFSKNDLSENFHPKLLGSHNLENIAAAITVGGTFGIGKKSALKILSKFKGIPFRMELIKVWHGVRIYNDTAATSPEAGIQAIKTLGGNLNSPLGCLILICGGMNKKMDYTKYAEVVGKFVKKVFFLEGDSTDEIKKQLSARLPDGQAISRQSSDKIAGTYNNFENLLTDIKKIVKPNDIILFSPAATSFNLFQNEFDRGRKFNQAVKKVFKDA